MRVLLELLAAAFIGIHGAVAFCDHNILTNIAKLGLNNDVLLKSSYGQYMFSWFAPDNLSDNMASTCMKFEFKKNEHVETDSDEEDDDHTLKIEKVAQAAPKEASQENVPQVVYHSPGVMAVYICDDKSDKHPPIAFVAQSLTAEGVEEDVKKAKEVMKQIGVTGGVDLRKCGDADVGSPVHTIFFD